MTHLHHPRHGRAQYLAAACIVGVMALFLLACSITSIYGAFNGGSPALVFVGAFFGIFGALATLATLYGFHKAQA